jgi:SAM-dependent methyltransferase
MPQIIPEDLKKAAVRGEPSHVWRAGQERRFKMLQDAAGPLLQGRVLVDGAGVGAYLRRIVPIAREAIGLDIELPRVAECKAFAPLVLCGAGENLPFDSGTMDLIWSHEVLEHVQDDAAAIREMVRVLSPGGRIVLFCPNRGYPFETHGHYWKGKYHFGNTPLINWLPRAWRDKLAPHVEVYTRRDLERLFAGLPVRVLSRRIVFGAYDNIISRRPRLGRLLRGILQALEKTPLSILGLSHFWVVEKIN